MSKGDEQILRIPKVEQIHLVNTSSSVHAPAYELLHQWL